MLGWLKRNPTRQLQKAYEQKLKQAMQAARNGDMRANATFSEEAEALLAEIEERRRQTP